MLGHENASWKPSVIQFNLIEIKIKIHFHSIQVIIIRHEEIGGQDLQGTGEPYDLVHPI